MNLLNKIRRKFKPSPELLFKVDKRHRIVFAFTSDGVDYYMFEKALELSYERALFAHLFYTEFQRGVDDDYIKQHTAAVMKIINSKRIELTKIYQLEKNLQDLCQVAFDPDLIWKIAAVTFFDKHEDPYMYDQVYALKKIERWKKSEDIKSFFLRLPLPELISFLKSSQSDIQSYSKVVEKQKKMSLSTIEEVLSSE